MKQKWMVDGHDLSILDALVPVPTRWGPSYRPSKSLNYESICANYMGIRAVFACE